MRWAENGGEGSPEDGDDPDKNNPPTLSASLNKTTFTPGEEIEINVTYGNVVKVHYNNGDNDFNPNSWEATGIHSGDLVFDQESSGTQTVKLTAQQIPGRYHVTLWAVNVDGVHSDNGNYVELIYTVADNVDITGSFNKKIINVTLGETAQLEGCVKVTNSCLNRVTVNVVGFDSDNRFMSHDFTGANLNSIQLENYSEFVIDTTAAPFNVPGTYTIKLYAEADNEKYEIVDEAVVDVVATPIIQTERIVDVICIDELPNYVAIGQEKMYLITTTPNIRGVYGNVETYLDSKTISQYTTSNEE